MWTSFRHNFPKLTRLHLNTVETGNLTRLYSSIDYTCLLTRLKINAAFEVIYISWSPSAAAMTPDLLCWELLCAVNEIYRKKKRLTNVNRESWNVRAQMLKGKVAEILECALFYGAHLINIQAENALNIPLKWYYY